MELDLGRMVDFSANDVRAGQRLKFDATLRPLERLELLPSWSSALLRSPQGGNASRETVARLLAVWHLAPRQTLRWIAQRSSVQRMAEPERGVAAYAERGRADSLTYAWRRSAGTTYYLGANRERSGAPDSLTRRTELFAKVQVDVDEWRLR
jgi:hypothetical protein